MGVVGDMRIKAGKHFLKKQGRNARKIQSCNWDTAKHIAIIYKIDDERSLKHVKWYIKEVKKKYGQRHMIALGYSDEKVAPAFVSHGLESDFFLKKDLNWFGKPSAKAVDNFVEQPFDLLIDFTDYDCVPLRFVLEKSKAKFKVGKYAKSNEPYYDLLIAIENEDLNHYMELIDKYIGMIKI
ncbi:MAG: hypothetical protein ACI9J3_001034 [Parvicellaceae bacterium]|jgi:hypothetical protein